MNDREKFEDCAERYRTIATKYSKAGDEVLRLRVENSLLFSALKEIVDGYNSPPYCEFDWYAWKQRAEKALASSKTPPPESPSTSTQSEKETK